jgi:hypothetical protein
MSFVDIEEYMKKDRDERRSHLDLEEPCIEIGGDSRQFRSHLAFHLGTTIPKGMRVHLCHACNNDRCANPKHHYWGSPRDNVVDQFERGTRIDIWDAMVKKHGSEKASAIRRESARKGGLAGGGHSKLSKAEIARRRKIIIECQPQRYGWVSRASKALGVSHTHVRRLVEEEMSDLKTYKRSKSCVN